MVNKSALFSFLSPIPEYWTTSAWAKHHWIEEWNALRQMLYLWADARINDFWDGRAG